MIPIHSARVAAISLCALGLTASFPTPASAAPSRIALLLADWDYNNNGKFDRADDSGKSRYFDDLPIDCENNNATADLVQLRSALEKRAFLVTVKCNLNRKSFSDAIQALANKSQNLPSGSIIFVYFSGHGIQAYGNEFGIPTQADKKIVNSAYDEKTTRQQINDIEPNLSNFQILLQKLNPRATITVAIALDNCRNNPFEGSPAFANSGVNEHVNMVTNPNVIIQYTTAPTHEAPATSAYPKILSAELLNGNELGSIMYEADVKLSKLYAGQNSDQRPDFNSSIGFTQTLGHYLTPPTQKTLSSLKVRNKKAEEVVSLAPRNSGRPMQVLWCEGPGEVERRVYAQKFAEYLKINRTEFGLSSIFVLPLSEWKNEHDGYGNVHRNIMRYDDSEEASILTKISLAYPEGGFLPQQGVGVRKHATHSVSAFVCGAVPDISQQELDAYGIK